MQEQMISTSKRHAKHLFAGRNTKHIPKKLSRINLFCLFTVFKKKTFLQLNFFVELKTNKTGLRPVSGTVHELVKWPRI